jgi:hypothetical protein
MQKIEGWTFTLTVKVNYFEGGVIIALEVI